MNTNNPNILQLITLLKSNNPQMVARQIIQQQFPSDPTMQNLLQMAERGDEQGLQQFATQFFNSRGLNFNSEMNNLMSTIKNM